MLPFTRRESSCRRQVPRSSEGSHGRVKFRRVLPTRDFSEQGPVASMIHLKPGRGETQQILLLVGHF